jgi:hypothetical protein
MLAREINPQNKPNATFIEKVLLIILIAMLVALVLLQSNPLASYSSRDGSLFAYAGHIILEGKLLYINVWDNKPPGIYYLNAFALWLGKDTRWGIWVVEFVFLFGAVWFGYRSMKTIWNPLAAIFATALWLWGLNTPLNGGNFTEEYSLLFNFLAIYTFTKSIQKPGRIIYDLVIGVCLGLSFVFRANNIGIEASILLVWVVILFTEKKILLLLQKLVMIFFGFVVVLELVSVYFLLHGTFNAMFFASITYNFFYAGKVGSNFWQSNIVNGFNAIGLAAWIALLGYLIILQRMIKGLMTKRLDEITLLLFIGWPIEIILSGLSGRGYNHYFISWLPIVALLCGIVFSFLFSRTFKTWIENVILKRMGLVFLTFILATLIIFWKDWVVYKQSFYTVLFNRGGGIEVVDPITQYVRKNTAPQDTIFIWGGEAGLNFTAKRDSPTAYVTYPLFANSPLLSHLDDGFLTDIMAHPPRLIIDDYTSTLPDIPSIATELQTKQKETEVIYPYWSVDNLDQVLTYLSDHYHFIKRIDTYNIFELNNH